MDELREERGRSILSLPKERKVGKNAGPQQPWGGMRSSLRLVLQPSGAFVEINQAEAIIGRHSQADVRLPLPDVSRRHCRLSFVDGGWQITDLRSLNGIHLNGQQVIQAFIDTGDFLRIGGFTFRVEIGQEPVLVRRIVETLQANPALRKVS